MKNELGCFFMKVPDEVRSISEIPDDYNSPPLRSYNDIIKVFDEVFPDADFSDPCWSVLENQISILEKLLNVKVSQKRLEEYNKYIDGLG